MYSKRQSSKQVHSHSVCDPGPRICGPDLGSHVTVGGIVPLINKDVNFRPKPQMVPADMTGVQHYGHADSIVFVNLSILPRLKITRFMCLLWSANSACKPAKLSSEGRIKSSTHENCFFQVQAQWLSPFYTTRIHTDTHTGCGLYQVLYNATFCGRTVLSISKETHTGKIMCDSIALRWSLFCADRFHFSDPLCPSNFTSLQPSDDGTKPFTPSIFEQMAVRLGQLNFRKISCWWNPGVYCDKPEADQFCCPR